MHDQEEIVINKRCDMGIYLNSTTPYEEYINKYPVIYIDFSEISKDCSDYKNYIDRIQTSLYQDLSNAYLQLKFQKEIAIWDLMSKIYNETGQKFIFIMDEWDAVFHMSFITEEDKQNYLLFLKSMLKSKPYVELAYMTGILPIAKYSDGSELNMCIKRQSIGKLLDKFRNL